MKSMFVVIVLLTSFGSAVQAQDAVPVSSHAAAVAELIEVMQLERAYSFDERLLNAVSPTMPGTERMR